MGCCSDAVSVLAASAPDPFQHVNYTKGMVLGVDDFTQEFTYLSGRDQWASRELIGYGTTAGLAVHLEDTANGPQIIVKRGAAAVPSGKLVCMRADQCGVINDWLAKAENAAKINRLLTGGSPPTSPPGSPPTGVVEVSLYLTLCWSDCQTSPVPIPGDPCRAEDSLMANSRIADDYRLELRTEPPAQTEIDAIRDFVAWLKLVPVVDGSPPPAADERAWVAALRAAAKPWFDAAAASPPLSPPASFATLGDYLFASPPAGLSVGRGHLCDFLRVAFRFWATELRAFWTTRLCGAPAAADEDCLLLARLGVPIVWVGGTPNGVWQVSATAAGLTIDESQRPYLAPMSLLQDWLLCGAEAEASAPVGPAQRLSPSDSPAFAGLTTTGSVRIAVATVSGPLTLGSTHHCVICVGALTMTLPAATPVNRGRVYIVKSRTDGTRVVTSGGDLIDGGPNPFVVNAGKAVTLVCDGAGSWHVISALA